MSVTCRNTGY